MSAPGLALAAGSGALATLALLLSPLAAEMPPLILPPVPLDLRLVALPLLFALAHAGAAPARWPWPALRLPSLAMAAAGAAHFQGSVVLHMLGNVPGSGPGERVDLGALLASGASVLLALAAGLDRARARLLDQARRLGVPGERVAMLGSMAEAHATRTLGFAGAAFVAFALAARVGDAAWGGAQAPLPELLGALLALALMVALFPGAGRKAPA